MTRTTLSALALILTAMPAWADVGQYNGKWLLKGIDSIGCPQMRLVLELTMKDGDVSGQEADFMNPWSGVVKKDGAVRVTGKQINTERMLLIEGHIREGVGTGQFYAVGGECRGTFEMTRE